MAQRKSWLPREGFSLDVVSTVLKQTLLNPTLTLPLWLVTRYTNAGRNFAFDNPRSASRLKILLYIGVARYVNGLLSRGASNNWTRATPDWSREFVLITGGSDGIGKLLVKLFAARGVKVVILDIQEPTFELPNTNIHFIKADLTDPAALAAASTRVKQQYGDPTVLVLNAGVINRHSIVNTPDHLLRRVFDLNILSQYRLARQFLPSMIKSNHGLICTTASLAGFVTSPGMVDYASTKAAVVAFHEGLTAELATWHNAPAVRTICICPNFVHTKLAEGFKNDAHFMNPTLHAETVAEIEFDRIWRWEGGLVSIPSVQSSFAMILRSSPMWLQNHFRSQLRGVMQGVANAEQERVAKALEDQEQRTSNSVVEVDKEFSEGSAMFA